MSLNPPYVRVAGFCPMGCGESLSVALGGHIVCGNPECSYPSAVHDILKDRETEHIVVADEDGFSVMHPLRERINRFQLECGVCGQLVEHQEDYLPGRYRIYADGTCERLED